MMTRRRTRRINRLLTPRPRVRNGRGDAASDPDPIDLDVQGLDVQGLAVQGLATAVQGLVEAVVDANIAVMEEDAT